MNKTNRARLRAFAFLLIALTMLSISGTGASAAQPAVLANIPLPNIVPASSYADAFARQTFDLMNAERAKAGSRALAWNQRIADVSQGWAAHLGVAMKDPNFNWANIHRPDAGGSLIPPGATWYRENIGINSTPKQIVDWWMSSAGHRAAMLDPRGTDGGLGYVVPTSGPYAGLHIVVTNLAAYAGTPVPPPPTVSGVLNAIDTSGTLWGYAAPGNATLGARTYEGSGWGNARQIIKVDWNSDGKLDIVARWANGYVTMYAGLGGNDYRAPINIGSGGWQDYEITATRLRKTDRYPGMVARDVVNGNLFYYPNTGGGAMAAGRIQIGFGGWSPMSEINAADWNGDGNMDLIVRNPAGELLLYRTNGAGAIFNEGRPVVDVGWNMMNRISLEPGFAGPGTLGIIARTHAGSLFYYPVANGVVQQSKLIGNGGWTGYVIASGSPR